MTLPRGKQKPIVGVTLVPQDKLREHLQKILFDKIIEQPAGYVRAQRGRRAGSIPVHAKADSEAG